MRTLERRISPLWSYCWATDQPISVFVDAPVEPPFSGATGSRSKHWRRWASLSLGMAQR